MHLGQRRHFNWIIGDESRLDISTFAEFAKDFVNQLALTHCVVDFLHFQFLADLADFFFALAVQVVTGLFLDSVEDRQTAVRSFEADSLSVDNAFRTAVYSDTDTFQQFFGEVHHPVVILVLNIEFHAGKFRIVGLVHTLVTEVLADFIYTFKTTYNQSLQIKFRCDTQVKVYIQRVMVRDERAGACSTGNRLQDRRFHFSVSGFIESVTQCFHYGGTLQECLFHTVVYHQVYITLAITEFGIFKRVVSYAVFIFYDRQRFDRLGKYGQFLGMDTDFAHLCTEHETFDTYEVT